jgi:hypothetical protein
VSGHPVGQRRIAWFAQEMCAVRMALRVIWFVLGYAAIAFLAIALLPQYSTPLFSARWPIILLGPLGFLHDAHYQADFLKASAIFIGLSVPFLVTRARFTRALAFISVGTWLFIGMMVLSLGY